MSSSVIATSSPRRARACAALASEYLWPNLLAPLVDRVEAAEPAPRSLAQDAAVALEAARYYAATGPGSRPAGAARR